MMDSVLGGMRRALRDVTTGLTILCGHEAPGGRFGGASDSDKDRIRATRETGVLRGKRNE